MPIRNSIFARLMATFFVAIILITLSGIYMYNWSLKTVKNEIINSSTAQVSFYLENLEDEMERIKLLQYDSLNDEYLGRLAVRYSIMNEYEMMESMRKLQQRLVSIHNSNAYIANVRAHILPIRKTISSTTSVSPLDMERFEQFRLPEGETGAQLVQMDDKLYLTTLQASSAGWPQIYMVEVELSMEALQAALGQFYTYPDSGSFLVNLTHDTVVSGKDNHVTLNDLVEDYRYIESGNIAYSTVNGQKMYIVAVKSDYLNMLLLRYIPQELIFVPLEGFYIWLWVFMGIGLLVIMLYTVYTYNLIHKPLRKLVRSFRRVESGDFTVSVHVNNRNEFDYLYRGFNSMVHNVAALIDQVYKQKILNQRAELKQLQSQISPHFLYNSLFLIHTMAKLKDENLVPFTKLLGDYFQFITRDGSDELSLGQEVEHARAYTDIQEMRFSMRLTVRFGECPGEVSDMRVPRLILQPIIENAFKYAVERTKGQGIVAISFHMEQDYLCIAVEDNGKELSDEKLARLQMLLTDGHNAETTGLINIHRRLLLLYGGDSGLRLERSAMGGLKATLRLDPKGRG